MKNIYNYFGIPKESVDIAVFFCFMALLEGTTTKSGSEIRMKTTPKPKEPESYGKPKENTP